jgi:hypothetical protein
MKVSFWNTMSSHIHLEQVVVDKLLSLNNPQGNFHFFVVRILDVMVRNWSHSSYLFMLLHFFGRYLELGMCDALYSPQKTNFLVLSLACLPSTASLWMSFEIEHSWGFRGYRHQTRWRKLGKVKNHAAESLVVWFQYCEFLRERHQSKEAQLKWMFMSGCTSIFLTDASLS